MSAKPIVSRMVNVLFDELVEQRKKKPSSTAKVSKYGFERLKHSSKTRALKIHFEPGQDHTPASASAYHYATDHGFKVKIINVGDDMYVFRV